ncbi:MAG TPA: nuclease-related domain-containing protein [Methylophilaceae bacterium]|nr:nuclease-related domain-containing protein [Methylophilaceae bacterium]
MSPILATYIPLAFFILAFVIAATLFKYWEWSTRRAKKKSPLTQDLLRGPGESLREKIDDMTLDLLGYMAGLILVPLMIYSMFLSEYVFNPSQKRTPYIVVIGLCVVFLCYLVKKIISHLKLRRKYNLGLEAEVAVGQELNLLMRKGYWVFHDFPADSFNIDHIVIGENGVFAIETKGRPKRPNKSGKIEAEVVYDGARLSFPGWYESKPIEQAQAQARWLQNWLTQIVGESVAAQPILTLPGWYIKRTNQKGIPVINGKNPSIFFERYGKQTLSEKLVNQIVFHVDQKCRTVAPRSYRAPPS